VKHGVHTFSHQCPYTLVLPQGYKPERAWPLVIALHGMGHTEEVMQRKLAPLLDRPWMWVFPRGVYPFEMRTPDKIRIGHAWYLYTGDQADLRASMAATTEYLIGLQDLVRKDFPISETIVAGFSQGGYLAGYVAPQFPERFRGAACIGGRLKYEFMEDAPANARDKVALAQFHGDKDEGVSPTLAREAADKCRALGFRDVDFFNDPDAGHEISEPIVDMLGAWLDRILS
jgi:predicted esterase